MSAKIFQSLASAFVLTLGACAAARPVAHGPFLLRPRPTSIDVAARTWEDARLRLDVRQLSGSPVLSIEESVAGRRHLFKLEGLEPGTRYSYRLVGITASGKAVLEEGTAATAPAAIAAPAAITAPAAIAAPASVLTPIRVAAVGDSGPLGYFQPKPQGRVAAEAARFKPDLLLHLGDIVYSLDGDPTREFAEAFFEPFQELLRNVPVCPTPGNHDQAIADGAAYNESFFLSEGEGGRYYSFDHGPAHFASLDTSTLRGFTQAQLEWLDRDLRLSVSPWKIIFTHHPPIGADGDGKLDDPAQLAPLLDIARCAGVRLILVGHEHAYLRYKPLGADSRSPILVVSGGGGATLSRTVGVDSRIERYAVRHHHLRLEISAESLELEAVGLGEEIFDHITLKR